MRLNNRFLSNNHLLVNDYFDANKRYVSLPLSLTLLKLIMI